MEFLEKLSTDQLSDRIKNKPDSEDDSNEEYPKAWLEKKNNS